MSYLNQFLNWMSTVVDYKFIVEGKGHLDHPEDLVFLQGSFGADRAVQAIVDTVKNPKSVTIKWDGYPALIWGYGPDGKFAVMDKTMFNKGLNAPARFIHSPQEFAQYDAARGKERSDLNEALPRLWGELQAVTPKTQGYYWGDVLFKQPLEVQSDGMYHFQANPNGIKYTVDASSDIGQKYFKGKQAGIAVHQFLNVDAPDTDESSTKQSLEGTIGKLRQGKTLSILPAAMPQTPDLTLDTTLVDKAYNSVRSYGSDLDAFMKNSPQTEKTIPVMDLFLMYINYKIAQEKNLNNLTSGFFDFVKNRAEEGKLSKVNARALLGYTDPETGKPVAGYLQQNQEKIKHIFQIWIDIYNLKMNLVEQLDKAAESSPVQGYLFTGAKSQEGFVSQGLKFVRRLGGFGGQNLGARRSMAEAETEKKPQKVTKTNKPMNTLVIYPGGFHPFHPGHASVFDHLAKRFPSADVFIAASDTTKKRPFDFDEKKFLANQSGIPNNRFVQVKSPYSAEEITQHYDPKNTQVIFVLSTKDENRIQKLTTPRVDGTPSKYKLWTPDATDPMDKTYYLYLAPTKPFKILNQVIKDASKIRSMYIDADDDTRKQIVHDLYPLGQAPNKTKKILDRVLSDLNEADNPNYFGGSSQSAIPGTPNDLRPQPDVEDIRAYQKEIRELKRFMGH